MTVRPTAPRLPRAARQQGIGLIEVMVAMSIGLILLGGVGYMFIGSKQMNTAQTDIVRIQESTRNALDVVGTAVRQAGYRLDMDTLALKDVAIEGKVGADSDILIVRHDPNWVVDVPAAGAAPNKIAGKERNCEGVEVSSNNAPNPVTSEPNFNTNLVIYQFRVVGGKLMCYANASASDTPPGGVVIADNVERMKVSYGIGDGNEAVTKYVDYPDSTELPKVSAVRLSLLLRGPSPGVTTGAQTVLFNDVDVTTNDGHLRRVVTSTFNVRNRARF
ncbi:MAG TPA: PilW family protein [Telluria sp.]|jgi:type IV pilus assembly protein PilW